MATPRRLLTVAAPLLAAALLGVAPASAQGGGGGVGGGGAAPPLPAVDTCAPFADRFGPLPDGSTLAGASTRGGCVVVTYSLSNVLSLVEVDALPGWTYVIKRGGNTDSRIQVDFTQQSTGDRASLRLEPGKTVIS